MSQELKRPRWLLWTVVALLLMVLYVASFGPACWWDSRRTNDTPAVLHRHLGTVFRPLLLLACSNQGIRAAVVWYAELGARDRSVATIGWLYDRPGSDERSAELLWNL